MKHELLVTFFYTSYFNLKCAMSQYNLRMLKTHKTMLNILSGADETKHKEASYTGIPCNVEVLQKKEQEPGEWPEVMLYSLKF